VTRRGDLRGRALAATILSVVLLGLVISKPWSGRDGTSPAEPVPAGAEGLAVTPGLELDPDFLAAVSLLQSGDYATAVEALRRFQARAPHVPEIHVNLGFAYLGLEQPGRAEESFRQALQLRPEQANAYYGMGLVHERRGDLDLARGAMRTFIHLADAADPYVRRARAALWEWEAPLARAKEASDRR